MRSNPMKKLNHDRIMTTIERQWLAEIIAGTKEDRVPPDQAILDETLREGLGAIRTAPAQQDESTRAGSGGADRPDHKRCWRVPIAH